MITSIFVPSDKESYQGSLQGSDLVKNIFFQNSEKFGNSFIKSNIIDMNLQFI